MFAATPSEGEASAVRRSGLSTGFDCERQKGTVAVKQIGIGSRGRFVVAGALFAASCSLATGIAMAGDPLSVNVTCPATLSAANGGALNLPLSLTNNTSGVQHVAKSALGVHLGNVDALGPFVIPLSATILPHQTALVPNYLSATFPGGNVAAAGTFVSLGVLVMDAANKPLGSGFCLVEMQ